MLKFETLKDALIHFLQHYQKVKRKNKEVYKRYRVDKGFCDIRRYCGQEEHLPRIHWVTPVPKKYEDTDLRYFIKEYMKPFVYEPIEPAKEKPERNVKVICEPPLELCENGKPLHKTDTHHYKQLLERLTCNSIDYGEEDESGTEG